MRGLSLTLGMVYSLFSAIISLFLTTVNCYGAPDTTLSISPDATAGTTATASDVNSRSSSIETWANAHSHLDISAMTSVNTFTIGDNTAGAKSYAIDNEFTTAPSIRYSNTDERWEFSNDASTFTALGGAPTWIASTSLSLNLTSQGDVSFTDLDLTSVTSATANTVVLHVLFSNSTSGEWVDIQFRKNGDTPTSTSRCAASDGDGATGTSMACQVIVGMDSGQVIEYFINTETSSTVALDVAAVGYWE